LDAKESKNLVSDCSNEVENDREVNVLFSLLLSLEYEALTDLSGVSSLLEGSSRELLEDVGVEVALEVLEGERVVEDL